jgi:large subunit ribosomal protein L5
MENITLKEQFNKTIAKDVQTKLGIKNVMATPKLTKIVVNMGVKDAVSDKKLVERMAQIVGQVTGQKPKIARAKKDISSFKLRAGNPIGVVVTLRGKRMYAFFDKIIKIVLPRIRDFRGVSRKSFDGHGNYTLGLNEYSVFPEIDLSTVERLQGLEIVIVTSAQTNKEGETLLESLGMPFTKQDQS